jgi:hypothetical protein
VPDLVAWAAEGDRVYTLFGRFAGRSVVEVDRLASAMLPVLATVLAAFGRPDVAATGATVLSFPRDRQAEPALDAPASP